MSDQAKPTDTQDRTTAIRAGRLLASSLRVTGADKAAETVDRLVELAYEDGGREAFFQFRFYLDDWEEMLRSRGDRP